ncbi:hypothetical protein [Enhygromyxa salina]|uniref:Uncharacterized protein n=1 Tax=Enhygromyxa salina TaxID=215803 RepID=A0A2S9YKU8_9BACT|nr:hypothetical protein [Enhygromyxa salina]PRQ05721.1 hypothetical protein ENSA7_43920 [Enhygromyxa salina]
MTTRTHTPLHRWAIPATLLALTTLTLGCEAQTEVDFDDPSLRAMEIDPDPDPDVLFQDDVCVVERGDLWESNEVVLADAVLRCPESRIRTPEIAIDASGLWGRLDGQYDVHFYIEHDYAEFDFEMLDELPGNGFTGQAPDGTLYRFTNNAASYLYNQGNDWIEVAIDGLPELFWPYAGFKIRPDSTGELHAQFETNGFGQYLLWAASLDEGEWSWAETSSLTGTNSTRYAGPDAWDRPVTILRKSKSGVMRWTLDVAGENDLIVGQAADYAGFLADPPRPNSGEGAPIAMIQRIDADNLAVITVEDGEKWSESPIADTPLVPKFCEMNYGSNQPDCPPCAYEAEGIEAETFRIVRTNLGPMWGVWVVSDIAATYVYDADQKKVDFWTCSANLDNSSVNADATLVVAELDTDGSILRSIELDIGSMWVADRPNRTIAATAFGDDIGVLIQTDTGPGETAGRVLRIDTTKIN